MSLTLVLCVCRAFAQVCRSSLKLEPALCFFCCFPSATATANTLTTKPILTAKVLTATTFLSVVAFINTMILQWFAE